MTQKSCAGGQATVLRTHLVELQHSKLDLLVLVLLLLGLGVGLLLTLLSSSQQSHDNVHGGLI